MLGLPVAGFWGGRCGFKRSHCLSVKSPRLIPTACPHHEGSQTDPSLSTVEEIKNEATNLLPMIAANEEEPEAHRKAQRLGMDLLTKVARIEESSFKELEEAIADEHEGLVNGLIQEMNNSIARHLNIS